MYIYIYIYVYIYIYTYSNISLKEINWETRKQSTVKTFEE